MLIRHFQRQSAALKLFVASICLSAFLAFLLLNLNAYLMDLPWILDSSPGAPSHRSRGNICLSSTFDFQKTLELQRQGMAVIRHLNGRTNVKATWALIPRHFNEIWRQQLDKLDLLRLQSDSEETKHFIKFSPQLGRPYACNVVTLGVGHSIWAERNLSRIYPECRFLAADPASEVNAELVQKQLGGTFLKAAVGGETVERTLINVWERDVELRGAHRRMVPQLGLSQLLSTQLKSVDSIDLLLIDVEGAEFGILEQLVELPERLPMPICQLNMEVHHPNELNANYTHQRFFRFFDRYMRSGPFALMHTDVNDDPRYMFLRLFLVNIADEVCTRKFLC